MPFHVAIYQIQLPFGIPNTTNSTKYSYFKTANSPNFQSVFFAGGSIIAISFNETRIIGEYQLTAPPYTSKFLFIKFSEFSLPNNAFSEHQVRIWNGNKNYTTEESRFILIGPKRVFEIKSFQNYVILSHNNPIDFTANYVECIYQTFDSKIFISSPLQGDTNEYTLEYKGSTPFTKLLVKYSDSTASYNKALFFQNKIIFLTSKHLIIIGTDQTVYSNISVNYQNEFLDMDIFDDKLVIADKSFINVYNLNDFQSSLMPTLFRRSYAGTESLITGIKFFSLNQGFICTNSTLYQFNISSNTKMHLIDLTFNTKYKIDATPDRVPVVFVKNQLSSHYYFLPPQDVYICQGYCQCINGFIANTVTTCTKQFDIDDGEQYNGETVKTCQGICQCQSGFIKTTSTTCQKQVLNPDSNTQIQSMVKKVSQFKNFFDPFDKDNLKLFTQAFANILTICSLNITPKIFVSFIAFIQDIWLYKYHKSKQEYPTTVNFFLKKLP